METIYLKIQQIKTDLSQIKLKKTGINKFSGFDYFELSDFLPTLISLCNKYKVCTYVTFDTDYAILTAVNSENPEEKISVTSPMRDLNVISKEGKEKMNELQALGAVQTYQRRYLYMSMFDIVECDSFDATSGNADKPQKQQPQQPQQQFQEEIKVFNLDWQGQTYAVEYVRKFSKKNNKYFYMIKDESQTQFFPKFINEDQ